MRDFLPNIFNIRISCSFWDVLAQIYIKRYKDDIFRFASAVFLVPNRRACLALTNAFIRVQGLQPTILPQIIPISEIDDDELFFSQFDVSGIALQTKRIISKEERVFLFARLIMSKPNDFGLKQISLAQAVNLALDLGNLIDTACNQGLSFDRLESLVPEKYATHWQETLKLLKIITEFWPQILDERDAMDAADLKNQLLIQQANIWLAEKTQKNIIAAGITANFPAIVNMLQTIQQLPNGEIYFAGIDCLADDEYWAAIDDSHPQFELKELLSALNITREQVTDVVPPENIEREKFISELMRPACVSDKWRQLDKTINLEAAIKGISYINCNTQRDEALAIALKLRQIIAIPEKTAALITYDRNLARRVCAELERFEIKADDSAGLPLNLSPIGIFLRLLVEAAEDSESTVKLITLLKHPFTLFHLSIAECRKKTYAYELFLRKRNNASLDEETQLFISTLQNTLNELHNALTEESIEFYDILQIHIRLAEILASSDIEEGKNILWRGDAGKCAAQFITKMLESAAVLGKIAGKDYLPLFSELMALESVRTNYGTHPRIHILGPIEARLNHFDYIILGEVNEGIWPKPAQADMWMSRPMKKDFGFNLPEKNIGILGADLCGFLASDNIIMTRAERIDGTPMKKSRWLLRLETILKALHSDIEALKEDDFFLLANNADKPKAYTPIKAPAPCPPLSARPRKLSASGVDLLVADPYSVFAKYILKLYPLDDLDMPMDQRDYGTLIHSIIEEFNNLYPAKLPDNALDILLNLGKKHFLQSQIDDDKRNFWMPKFEKTAEWIIEQEKKYRSTVRVVHNEICGEIQYNLPNGPFSFTAIADRIDELEDGTLNIIDYKTGQFPSYKQVCSGHALQLSLEGLIASKNGFTGIKSNDVCQMIYWQLGTKKLEINPKEESLIEKCEDYLLRLISTFDFETTPYHSRPVPKFIPKNKDYEHLARIKEWSVQENGEGGDD
ncbi:MAG: PD-(D/E)XK nuclease family protein [Acetobacter sp.]|nr:PD-(D/E)XK nuclease family protein [Acetobacter sp.]